ncbi:hypothetical protein L7F22_004812, partial [Adiantum nelumboides]|nr:hypothetical protein [Adiantum nelumboides]
MHATRQIWKHADVTRVWAEVKTPAGNSDMMTGLSSSVEDMMLALHGDNISSSFYVINFSIQ